ncbi:MAG: ASCH domain-containing protein [Verrucomicrobiota bacterium]
MRDVTAHQETLNLASDADGQSLASLPCSPRVALSIRQPWAWLIVNGHKDIENRTWPTRFRGQFLVHAGKGMTKAEYKEARWVAEDNGIALPAFGELERGGIVGVAEITDCVNESESPWFFGKWGFVLRDAKPIDIVPCRGALGFFTPANSVISHTEED